MLIKKDFVPHDNVLMVIADYPSMTDWENKTVFRSGKESIFWDVAVNACSVKRSNIYPTYIVKYRNDDGTEPTEDDIRACQAELIREIKTIEPKAILLLGNLPLQAFGIKGTVDANRGKIIDIPTSNTTKIKVVPTYSSHAVATLGTGGKGISKMLMNFAKDIDKAYSIANGSYSDEYMTRVVPITTMQQVDEVIEYIKQTGECCFDFETTEIEEQGTFAPDFKATLLSLSFQHGSSYTIPLFHPETCFTEQEILAILGKVSRQVFANSRIRKLAWNIKYDMHVMCHYGFPVFRGRLDDGMLMHHLYDETQKHGLKEVAPQYYPQVEGYENKIKDEKGKVDWATVELAKLSPYAGTDTDVTFRVCTILEGKLLEDKRVYSIYRNLAMGAVKPLLNAEREGMLIDKPYLLKCIERATFLLKKREEKLLGYPQVRKFEELQRAFLKNQKLAELNAKTAGKKGKNLTNHLNKITAIKAGIVSVYEGFNMSSPIQMAQLLYTKAGFGFTQPKTKKKGVSTDAKVLKRIVDNTGFIHDLFIYRTIDKNLSTYLIGLLELLDENDRIHSSFLIHGTTTGRLASRNPNLQNISKHVKVKDADVEEVVGMIMRLFSVPEGYGLVALDFSQAELRIVADFAEEDNMIAVYNSGGDIHSNTAASLKRLTLEEFKALPDDERDYARFLAKASNFGLCMKGDTKVVTIEGTVNLMDITVGQEVLTHRGNWKKVTDTQHFKATKMLRVTTQTGKEFTATPDHMMYKYFPSANGKAGGYGWVEVQDLQVGDYLVPNEHEYTHATTDYFSYDYARIIGWYVAEGNYGEHGIKISQFKKANEDVYAKMGHILVTHGFHVINAGFYIGGAKYARLQERCKEFNFLTKSHGKKLGIEIGLLSYRDKVQFLAGLWDGDGTIYGYKTKNCVSITYTTVSEELVNEIQQMLYGLGINTKIYKYPLNKNRISVTYIIHVVGNKSKMKFLNTIPTVKCYRYSYKGTRQANSEEKIVSIELLEGGFDVYDITVDSDHSFIANGLISHNCYGQEAPGYKTYAEDSYGVIMSLDEATNNREAFFEAYPKLLDYHAYCKAKAHKFGYTRTLFGRKRHALNINSSDEYLVSEDERSIVNSPVQGTCGEMTILAFSLLHKMLPKSVKFVNTVHDSIVFYSPIQLVPFVAKMAKQIAENLPTKKYFGRELKHLKLVADIEVSTTCWKETRKYSDADWKGFLASGIDSYYTYIKSK